MSEILLLNGPNLSMLGQREPHIYGTDTLQDIEAAVSEEVRERGWKVRSVQHDCEGALIRTIQDSYGTVGAIINPGASMMPDGACGMHWPTTRDHGSRSTLSNVWARERFPHESVLAPLASGVIVGLGALGYHLAARALLAIVSDNA